MKHQEKFENCGRGVVYGTPLTYDCVYIGQSGRCVNEKLGEHKHNVEKAISGHLALHCQSCGSVPVFQNNRILHGPMTELHVKSLKLLKLKK